MNKKKLFKYALLAGAAYLVVKSVNGGSLAGLGNPPGYNDWPAWRKQQYWRSRGRSHRGFGGNSYNGGENMPDTFSTYPFGQYGNWGGGYGWGGTNYGSPNYNPVYLEPQGSLAYENSYLDALSEGN
jgi:hypothetical protein